MDAAGHGGPAAPGALAGFGLGFQSDKALRSYERLAAAAEAMGFDVLSVFSDLWYQPPLAALLAMARATSRVRLGAACHNPFLLHPVEIAGQVATLDAASGGRAYLGLARGSWLGELGVDQSGALAAVAEAAQVIEALLSGDRSGVTGRRFFLPPGARLRDGLARRRVPLLIGTWGPRLAGIAGHLADEVKVGGSANPAMVAVLRRWLDDAATGAGRPPGGVGVVLGAVTVVDEDGAAARRRARREVAMYLEVVGALDPTVELPPGLTVAIGERLRAGDAEGAGALVPDELLGRFCFAGTPGEVADHAATLIEAGARRVEFGTPHGLSDELGVELLGRRVLPRLRELAVLKAPETLQQDRGATTPGTSSTAGTS